MQRLRCTIFSRRKRSKRAAGFITVRGHLSAAFGDTHFHTELTPTRFLKTARRLQIIPERRPRSALCADAQWPAGSHSANQKGIQTRPPPP